MKKVLHTLAALLLMGSVFALEAAELTITGNDTMKFDTAAFEVKSGEKVKLTFKNLGKLPKAAMGHNLVILKKGTDVPAFATAAMMAKATDYIAPAKKGDVVASTKVLGPGETEVLEFTAGEPGEYPFICSFPGHYVMMKGVMTVK